MLRVRVTASLQPKAGRWSYLTSMCTRTTVAVSRSYTHVHNSTGRSLRWKGTEVKKAGLAKFWNSPTHPPSPHSPVSTSHMHSELSELNDILCVCV